MTRENNNVLLGAPSKTNVQRVEQILNCNAQSISRRKNSIVIVRKVEEKHRRSYCEDCLDSVLDVERVVNPRLWSVCTKELNPV